MGGARSGLTHSQLHSHTIHQVREGPAGQVAQSSDLVTVMTCARKMVLVGYCCVQAALAGDADGSSTSFLPVTATSLAEAFEAHTAATTKATSVRTPRTAMMMM